MIRIGYDDDEKRAEIVRYCDAHAIRHTVVFSPARFPLRIDAPVSHEHVEWAEIILYRFYYRLLQQIDKSTLLVVNECLRTQNRHDLTYNCLRNFLQQTAHQIVFQRFPLIDSPDDAMILVDLDTRSRWRDKKLQSHLLRDVDVRLRERPLSLRAVDVPTDAKTRAAYAREKRELVDGIGLRDPHTIPRQLHLMGGRAKLAAVSSDAAYVGRNGRFGLPNLRTYREDGHAPRSTLFEFCHGFLDFSDFLTASGQMELDALVSDLPVDRWYFDRYAAWMGRVRDAYAVLRG